MRKVPSALLVTFAVAALALVIVASDASAATYNVGPGQPLASIGEVPWDSLAPGDVVRIHYRAAPYQEKWVICRQGTPAQPIVIQGVLGPLGERPIIDGNGALTAPGLNYWNEDRGVIKIGGANNPPDTLPQYIVIENLEVWRARPPYNFTDDGGSMGVYTDNAAGIYVEKCANLTIRNCVVHDCGNGIFIGINGGQTTNVVIEGNYIYDNGIVGSIFQHNTYTEAWGITYQYNRFGPLRTGCDGNNLKDRSGGCIIRYNWIEGGNRQLDLVDTGYAPLTADPIYNETFVYGNYLIEPDGAGNSQIIHYGGDSGTTSMYRQGTMYLHHNTVVSTRVGNTTLMRLSTNNESCDARNNIVYVTDSGNRLALLNAAGTLDFQNNWFKPGYVDSHSGLTGTYNDLGNFTGAAPGFLNEAAQDFRLGVGADARSKGGALAAAVLPTHAVVDQYVKHQQTEPRPIDGSPDIGAHEYDAATPPAPEIDLQRPAGTTIVNGGTDAIGNRTTGNPANIVYTIANLGNADLNLTGPIPNLMVLSGQSNCTATVSAPPATPVLPSGQTTFTITITPTADGAFSVVVTIDNDDSDENPTTITISGTGVTGGGGSGGCCRSSVPGVGAGSTFVLFVVALLMAIGVAWRRMR